MRFFKLMGAEIPVVFNAGAISKWLSRIEKSEADIIQSLAALNDHETCQLIYTGMEYGYGMLNGTKCPYTFYEVEEFLLEEMSHTHQREFEDLVIYAIESVTGRLDRMAKKNGFDLNMSETAKLMRKKWEEADPAKAKSTAQAASTEKREKSEE